MDRWIGKFAVVTGTTMGIGAVIAETLLDLGVNVVGLARREHLQLELAKNWQGKKGKFYPMKVDVTNEQELLGAFERIKRNIGPVHILINNAGVYRAKGLLDGTTEAWRNTLDTNILAVCVATREAIKDMRENNVDGHIIHMGSVIPNYRLPNVNFFPATKVAINTITETLRRELNSIPSKIKVSCINPGHVDTIDDDPALEVNDDLEEFCKVAPRLEPIDVANAIVYVLSTPPHVQVHEMTIRPVGEYI